MKTTAIAIALLMGGAAFAQSNTTTTPTNMDHSKMDHSKMDPSKMDHSKMDHSTTNQSATDQSTMDHSRMNQSTTNSTMNNATVNQSTTSQSTMDHSTTNHSTMAWNASGGVIQPGNAAPERDARGIPVISAPAFVPAGWNGSVGPAVGGPLVDSSTGDPVDADEVYPACTAQITDNCVQAYEVGRRR